MQSINAHLVPWLVAEFGPLFGSDYADFGKNKTATAMIAQVVMTEVLCSYTEQTFQKKK